MVSFSCEVCGDILTKKKLDPHRNRCYGATFTCLDCMVHFTGTEYRAHISCMTEAQKYQGSLYKEKNSNNHKKIKLEPATPCPQPTMTAAAISRKPYVEDAPEEIDVSRFLQPDDDDGHDVPPEAPSPPSAIQIKPINVFDFFVGPSTPNPSNTNLPKNHSPEPAPAPAPVESNELVPFDYKANGADPDGFMIPDDSFGEVEPEPAPATAPVQTFQTPAPRLSRKSLDEKVEAKKKDKKRKRLHIDTSPPRDEVMTDAPPVLHSGLTGGLNRMTVFPPSPDYSGGDNEPSPTTPLKKKKHSKHAKSHRPESGFFGLLASKPSKSKKRKTSAATEKPKSKSAKAKASPKKSTHSHHRHSSKEAPKMLEYKSDDREADNAQQMIIYKPRVDLFMGLVNKGPDSDRGCSLNKALKRYHRERSASGNSLSKEDEQKELFRSLRLRKNDRGEIVLFSADFESAESLLKED